MAHLVLLADDSITIRKVVELTFQGTEIRVDAVGSGREAIERLETIRPDLVLADVDMPEPSGYDLCRHVKGSDHPVPVLLMTGAFEPFDPAEAERCGADGHLVKPFDSGYLVKQVEEFLRRPGRLRSTMVPPTKSTRPIPWRNRLRREPLSRQGPCLPGRRSGRRFANCPKRLSVKSPGKWCRNSRKR